MKPIYILAILLTAIGFGAIEAAEPIALHPENPHYFIWRGRPTVLITSGEHYGAVLNADFDFVRYLDALAKDGLNHTRTFSGTYREIPSSFGITDNPLAPKPLRYVCPWARSDQPGYYDGGNRFDLKKWNPAYFTRLHDFMRAAQERGIVVEFNLFCPFYNDDLWNANPMNARNNVNGIGRCPREEVYALKHADLTEIQLAFVRKVVTELREYDNLYYEVCNEPYFGGVTEAWQWKIADTIAQTEKELNVKHLISMNIANGRAKVEKLHPDVKILNFHYCVPPDTVALNYQWNVVIGENETGFRGKDDILYRTEGWDFILSGGALYNNLDYSFTPGHPDGTLLDYKSPGGGSPQLRQQLAILKRFVEELPFLKMQPDTNTVRQVEPALTSTCLSQKGRAYAIYFHVPLPNKPKNLSQHLQEKIRVTVQFDLPKGQYQIRWLDTKTGEWVAGESKTHQGGILKITSPVFDNDIACRIDAK
ncbi:MAG: cellulase family glycosylhydrolase [Thermogutta sp.]